MQLSWALRVQRGACIQAARRHGVDQGDAIEVACIVQVFRSDLTGQRLARLGDVRPGEAPGQFVAPHGLAVDSRGDMYVGEVSWSAYGRLLDPPRTARCMRKLVRQTKDERRKTDRQKSVKRPDDK